MSDEPKGPVDVGHILETVLAKLREKQITVDLTGDVETCCGQEGRVKLVCVVPGLGDSVRELGKSPRDQVVMVRVDEATSQALDAWVATGAVKSRSEAAALFIREGLKVRADELARLRDSLRELDEAKERLHRRAMEVFGAEPPHDKEG
jgi:Arc/MetJ-type ribon-helix-helix transcriptional regulator